MSIFYHYYYIYFFIILHSGNDGGSIRSRSEAPYWIVSFSLLLLLLLQYYYFYSERERECVCMWEWWFCGKGINSFDFYFFQCLLHVTGHLSNRFPFGLLLMGTICSQSRYMSNNEWFILCHNCKSIRSWEWMTLHTVYCNIYYKI